MARKIKMDNSIQKRIIQNERKIGGKPKRQYFLIVCEGEKTEPNYFASIKKLLPRGIIEFIHIQGTARNTKSLVDWTEKFRDKQAQNNIKYDQTWAVFDKDSFLPQDFDNAINKGENMSDKINCAWTNEAFELWYLLHFEYISAGMSREDYEPRLEEWLTKKMGKPFKYEKNLPNMYEILQEFGKPKQAILWAEKLEKSYEDKQFSTHNPCTKVHHLIKALEAQISR